MLICHVCAGACVYFLLLFFFAMTKPKPKGFCPKYSIPTIKDSERDLVFNGLDTTNHNPVSPVLYVTITLPCTYQSAEVVGVKSVDIFA